MENGGKDPNTIFVDYSPQSGVTFRENKNSDVQIVGKGYNDDASSTDSRSTLNGITNNRKDRRRVTKGNYLNFYPVCVLAILPNEPRHGKTNNLHRQKTKTQISFAVLISAFVFATWIVQFLYFLNPKFPASNHLL